MSWTQYLEQFIGAASVIELRRRFDQRHAPGGACHAIPDNLPSITPPTQLSAPEDCIDGRPKNE